MATGHEGWTLLGFPTPNWRLSPQTEGGSLKSVFGCWGLGSRTPYPHSAPSPPRQDHFISETGITPISSAVLKNQCRALQWFLLWCLVGLQYMVPSTQYKCSVHSTQYSGLGTQYLVYNTQYSILSTQYSVLSTQHIVLSTCIQYSEHSKQYSVHSSQYTVHSTQYTAHNTQYSVHSTQYSVRST